MKNIANFLKILSTFNFLLKGKAVEDATKWKKCFAILSVRVGTYPDGSAKLLRGWYEERWTGDGDTGSAYMERRQIGSDEVQPFSRDRVMGIDEDRLIHS